MWLLAHQLGFFYADGSLVRTSRKAAAAMTGVGLASLYLLTHVGPYSKSMVGGALPGASNNSPPSIALVAMTLWIVGGAMLARPYVSRWLAGKRAWGAVIAANSIIMTVFLWHLSAYLVAIVLLYPLGLGRPQDSTPSWWLQRPVWIVVPLVLLAPVVALLGRFERPRRRAS